MSVSQAKKMFESLESYLAGDVTGRERLKKLKDAVNEIRKRASSAEQEAASSREQYEIARKRADDLSIAAESLNAMKTRLEDELRSAKSRIALLEQKESSASQSDDVTDDDDANVGDEDFSVFRRGVRELIKRAPSCPYIDGMKLVDGNPDAHIKREDIAEGFSVSEMAKIGTVVTLLSFVGECVVVSSSTRPGMFKGKCNEETRVNLLRSLARWARKTIDWSDNGKDWLETATNDPKQMADAYRKAVQKNLVKMKNDSVYSPEE